MGRLVDPRRQLQQEIIALEVYRRRIFAPAGEYGDKFQDWIKAGHILDMFEDGEFKNKIEDYIYYKQFLMLGYIDYINEVKNNYEREINEAS